MRAIRRKYRWIDTGEDGKGTSIQYVIILTDSQFKKKKMNFFGIYPWQIFNMFVSLYLQHYQ